MTKIVNKASLVNDEKNNLLRGAIEHRATWMALMYLEAKRLGYDAEKITRTAVRKTGNNTGKKLKEGLENPSDISCFTKAFLTPEVLNAFEMEIKGVDKDEMKVEFSYCPLVNAWRKLDIEDETIDLLCDMAMDGDRGIAEAVGINFKLSDTIAKGCNKCKLHFYVG